MWLGPSFCSPVMAVVTQHFGYAAVPELQHFNLWIFSSCQPGQGVTRSKPISSRIQTTACMEIASPHCLSLDFCSTKKLCKSCTIKNPHRYLFHVIYIIFRYASHKEPWTKITLLTFLVNVRKWFISLSQEIKFRIALLQIQALSFSSIILQHLTFYNSVIC